PLSARGAPVCLDEPALPATPRTPHSVVDAIDLAKGVAGRKAGWSLVLEPSSRRRGWVEPSNMLVPPLGGCIDRGHGSQMCEDMGDSPDSHPSPRPSRQRDGGPNDITST